VLGFTPLIGRAAPGSECSPELLPESEAPAVESTTRAQAPTPGSERPGRLEIITSAIAIVVHAVALDREQAPIVLGSPPIALELPAGRYRIEAAGPGYHPWSRELEIGSGELVELQVEPELIDVARLELRALSEASEGASVRLDGAMLCTLPCSSNIEPGAHRLDIDKRRHKGLHFAIDVAQADALEIDVKLEPATPRAPAIVTGAVALTSLTVAIGFTVRAARTRRSLANDLDALEQYDADDRRIDNGKRDAVIATSLYGVTAAVGLLTLYYLLRQPGVSSRANLRRHSLAGRGRGAQTRLAQNRWQLVPVLYPSETLRPGGGGLQAALEF
jgi:hypothetical protein